MPDATSMPRALSNMKMGKLTVTAASACSPEKTPRNQASVTFRRPLITIRMMIGKAVFT